MLQKPEEQPPPGSPEALERGCVCSPNQNRNGAGVRGPDGAMMFFALYWCPVHGITKGLEAIRRGETELR